jgi:hypothetical protein
MTARFAVGLCVVAWVVSACASSNVRAIPPVQISRSPKPTPSAVSTLVAAGSHCRQLLGGTVSFQDPRQDLALRVTTARPRVVDHALASYAHNPANGYYLVVDVNLKNISGTGLRLDPTHFVFTTTAGRRLTVDSGNAPYSGASHVLDPTFLVSQAGEHGPLIYDTPQVHGRIAFTVSGKTACTWTL